MVQGGIHYTYANRTFPIQITTTTIIQSFRFLIQWLEEKIEYFENVRPDQVQEITTAFMEFDGNRNGVITAQEMKECLRRSNIQYQDAEVDRVISNMDTNRDGTVSYDEYMKFMARVYTGQFDQFQRGSGQNPPQPQYNQNQPQPPYNQNQPPYNQNQPQPPYNQNPPPPQFNPNQNQNQYNPNQNQP